MSYFAYTLSNGVRESLKMQFPPKFSDFIGQHITVWFGGNPPDVVLSGLGQVSHVKVIGYAADESLEALVVAVDGESERPDGKVYHITWSLDREQGRKPVDSNAVIAAGKVHLINNNPVFSAVLEKYN